MNSQPFMRRIQYVYLFQRVGTLMDAEEILTALNTGKFVFFQWTAFLKLAFVYMRGVWPVFGIMFLGRFHMTLFQLSQV